MTASNSTLGGVILGAMFMAGLVVNGAADTPEPARSIAPFLYWDRGVRYEVRPLGAAITPVHDLIDLESRTVRGRIAGKLHMDGAFYDGDEELGNIDDDADFRRARLYTAGEADFFLPLDYHLEFGYNGSSWSLHSAYVTCREIPWLNSVRVGHFKAPMSISMLGSSRDLMLMERGSPVEAFAPGYRLGLGIGGPEWNDRITWWIGGYADVAEFDTGDASESLRSFHGRLTGLPWWEEPSSLRYLHLGLSGSYSDSGKDSFRYRSRPESFLAPYLVDTGDIAADRGVTYGLELVLGRGPWTVQSEVLQAFVNAEEQADPTFSGFYLQGSWFATGESRPYQRDRGTLGQVLPSRDFSLRNGTWGAFELTARVSQLDLKDREIDGGKMDVVTGGLTWYWNRYMRLMLNGGYADVEGPEHSGNLRMVQGRWQLQF